MNLLGEIAADEEQHHLHAEVQQQPQQHQPGERPPSPIAGVGIGGGTGGGGESAGARPPSTLPPEPQVCCFVEIDSDWVLMDYCIP